MKKAGIIAGTFRQYTNKVCCHSDDCVDHLHRNVISIGYYCTEAHRQVNRVHCASDDTYILVYHHP